MKGGLLINNAHIPSITSNDEAIQFFKDNSKFSILTNSSAACITFKAELNIDIVSPYINIRSGIVGMPVRILLFKYFIISPLETVKDTFLELYTKNDRVDGVNFIMLSNANNIKSEYEIQLQIYGETYNTISSAYDPVCPYPINYSTTLQKDKTITELIQLWSDEADRITITDTLGGNLEHFGIEDKVSYISVFPPRSTNPYKTLLGNEARKNITTLGCIVMEFMDGFITLEDLEKVDNEEMEKAYSLATYELTRLEHLGFKHGDLHSGNVMYNKNYKYIPQQSQEDGDVARGKALIIDFGNSSINTANKEKIKEARWQQFYDPYTFEKIYHERLIATITFREKMINDLNKILEEYEKLDYEEKKKMLQTSELLSKLMLNSIYPNNIHKKFNEELNEVKTSIFELKKNKIVELEEKAKIALAKFTLLIQQIRQVVAPIVSDKVLQTAGTTNGMNNVQKRRLLRMFKKNVNSIFFVRTKKSQKRRKFTKKKSIFKRVTKTSKKVKRKNTKNTRQHNM